MKCKNCTLDHPGYVTCKEALAKKKAEDMRVALNEAVELPQVASSLEMPGKVVNSETVVFKCPVCEARRLKNREAVRKWRAKK